MSTLQLVILALVQGLTEFLPVSSSAHLILVSWLADWPDQGLVVDVAVHLGTLVAVILYFRHDLWRMAVAWLPASPSEERTAQRRLGLLIALASLPVLVTGLLAYPYVADLLRDVRVIGWATLFFGVALLVADRRSSSHRKLADLRLPGAVMIGLAQVLALIPGASRSGVTMMMGRAIGLDTDAAARFSFLLSIPVIGAAGLHGLWQVVRGGATVAWSDFALAAAFAALAGWACIAIFLALLRRLGLLPFIIYRLVLGVVLVSLH